MDRTTLNTECYTIDDGKIVKGILNDFRQFIETTTRPTGVGPAYYATTIIRPTTKEVIDDEGNIIEAEGFDDVWALAHWVTWGGPEVIIDTFETEAEAEEAAEDIYISDILNNSEMCIYLSLADAERVLAELVED